MRVNCEKMSTCAGRGMTFGGVNACNTADEGRPEEGGDA